MPPPSGIKHLVPTAFLRRLRALAYSAASASHSLQEAQRQLLQEKRLYPISEAQPAQSFRQSVGSLAQTQSAQTWYHAQASHNQQRHQLLAGAIAPAAPSAQSPLTASSGTALQQQHPAYQQQLPLNIVPYQRHSKPLQLQPFLPWQQQLTHHHHLLHHKECVLHHTWPHQGQHVHHFHFDSHHHLPHAQHHYLLHQQHQTQQQQQQFRRGMATRSIPFVDRVRMVVEGGKGGNGCVSFTQVARGRRQAASGGNGGDGGGVVLRASKGARELRGLPRAVRGGLGGHGRPNGRTGAQGDTCIVDVPVGMVVSLLEDAPSEAFKRELPPPTTTTMQSGTAVELGSTMEHSNWAPSTIHKQDNLTSSTTSLRKRLYHDQDYSDTNISSSAQRASPPSSPAKWGAVSRADADSSYPLTHDFQATSLAGADRSFPLRHDLGAASIGWPAEEQGAKVSRRHSQNGKSKGPHDHGAIGKGLEEREGTGEPFRPQRAAHFQQEGVAAGGGPVWDRRGEEDSEDEECEDDEDDVEVEEDEEEEEEEEFEEGMGWEDGGDDEVGEAEQKPPQRLRVLAELLELGQQITVAVGGYGGSGNASTPTPSRSRFRPPSAHEPSSESTQGSMGSSATLVLVLKMLADVGLVGMPNAGKSSLLKALTGARAKVGSYAFTTLHPQLGTIVGSHALPLEGPSSSDSMSRKGSSNVARSRQRAAADDAHEGSYQASGRQSLVLADIPGLISGAHEDRGRGNLFLRHVERVGCIAYVIDLSGGQREANSLVALTPAEQLAVLQEELQAYRACRQEEPLSTFHDAAVSNESQAKAALREPGTEESLVQAFELVIANKVDACVRPQQALAELKESTHLPIIPVSALHAAGLERLASALQTAVHSARSRC